MYYGFCHLPVIPLRKEPKSSSEQVSQLLFGDYVRIIDNYNMNNSVNDSWFEICNLFDNYKGWIDSRSILIIDENQIFDNKYITNNFVCKVLINNNQTMFVPVGCRIPNAEFTISDNKFSFYIQDISKISIDNTQYLIEIAKKYLNCPYQWGGKNVFGIDCSGFVQNVYSFLGINLKRDANQQVLQGQEVDFQNKNIGDLAFFHNSNGKINHVGICLNDNTIIHASSKVRIDVLSNTGIHLNENLSIISHQLDKIIRIF